MYLSILAFVFLFDCVHTLGEQCILGQYEVSLETLRCREFLWLPPAWLPWVLQCLRSSFQTPIMHKALLVGDPGCVFHSLLQLWMVLRQPRPWS